MSLTVFRMHFSLLAEIFPALHWGVLTAVVLAAVTWTAYRVYRRDDIAVIDCWTLFGAAAVAWWVVGCEFDAHRTSALVGTSLASFMAGGIVGFLFTSYGEEAPSVGRVRDWLLAGIVTFSGVKLAESGLGTYGKKLVTFLAAAQADQTLQATALVIFSVLGFFNFFFVRETVWNPMFADARLKRRELEKAAEEINKRVSIAETEPGQAPIVPNGAQPAVNELVKKGSSATSTLAELKALSKAQYAKLRYDDAITTLGQILERDPDDREALLYLSHILITADRPLEAVPYLERLQALRSVPVLALKLLGYALLWDPERLDEAIEASEAFLRAKPNDAGAEFNLACAYAQKGPADSGAREKMERWLDAAIAHEPAYRIRVRALINEDFEKYSKDSAFREKYLM